MLIILCILFPPAIPFVIIYYLCRGGSQRRQGLAIQRRTMVATERLAGIEPPPYWTGLRVTAVTFIAIISVVAVLVVHANGVTP
jgi:hypothetical protein